jgi:hypothetical protein
MTVRPDKSTPAAAAAGRRLGRALCAAVEVFSPRGYQTLQREALSAARRAGQLNDRNELSLQGMMIAAAYVEQANRRAERAEGVMPSKRFVPFC